MRRDHLASLDQLIAHHLSVAEHLRRARAIMAGEPPEPSRTDTKLLTGPSRKKAKGTPRRPTKDDDEGEPITMELDGVDITVTAAQAQILELLGESDDYVTAAAIGEKLKLSVPVVKRLIYNLRGRISKAGLRAQINGYRKLGFRLEAEGEAQ
jgi:hypothetical protein